MPVFVETERLSGCISLTPMPADEFRHPPSNESIDTVGCVLNDEMTDREIAAYKMGSMRVYTSMPGTTTADFFYKPAENVIIAVSVRTVADIRTIRWIWAEELTAAALEMYTAIIDSL